MLFSSSANSTSLLDGEVPVATRPRSMYMKTVCSSEEDFLVLRDLAREHPTAFFLPSNYQPPIMAVPDSRATHY